MGHMQGTHTGRWMTPIGKKNIRAAHGEVMERKGWVERVHRGHHELRPKAAQVLGNCNNCLGREGSRRTRAWGRRDGFLHATQ